jgi:hypothetical protein
MLNYYYLKQVIGKLPLKNSFCFYVIIYLCQTFSPFPIGDKTIEVFFDETIENDSILENYFWIQKLSSEHDVNYLLIEIIFLNYKVS